MDKTWAPVPNPLPRLCPGCRDFVLREHAYVRYPPQQNQPTVHWHLACWKQKHRRQKVY